MRNKFFFNHRLEIAIYHDWRFSICNGKANKGIEIGPFMVIWYPKNYPHNK
jgi:hypothetical protein